MCGDRSLFTGLSGRLRICKWRLPKLSRLSHAAPGGLCLPVSVSGRKRLHVLALLSERGCNEIHEEGAADSARAAAAAAGECGARDRARAGARLGSARGREGRSRRGLQDQAGRVSAFARDGDHELVDRRLRAARHELSRIPKGRRLGGEGNDVVGSRQRQARAVWPVRTRLVQRKVLRDGDDARRQLSAHRHVAGLDSRHRGSRLRRRHRRRDRNA